MVGSGRLYVALRRYRTYPSVIPSTRRFSSSSEVSLSSCDGHRRTTAAKRRTMTARARLYGRAWRDCNTRLRGRLLYPQYHFSILGNTEITHCWPYVLMARYHYISLSFLPLPTCRSKSVAGLTTLAKHSNVWEWIESGVFRLKPREKEANCHWNCTSGIPPIPRALAYE